MPLIGHIEKGSEELDFDEWEDLVSSYDDLVLDSVELRDPATGKKSMSPPSALRVLYKPDETARGAFVFDEEHRQIVAACDDDVRVRVMEIAIEIANELEADFVDTI